MEGKCLLIKVLEIIVARWLFRADVFRTNVAAPEEGKIIRLHHPLDGVTNPEYKLLRFKQLTKFFCKEKKALAFNQDRCCHLALC